MPKTQQERQPPVDMQDDRVSIQVGWFQQRMLAFETQNGHLASDKQIVMAMLRGIELGFLEGARSPRTLRALEGERECLKHFAEAIMKADRAAGVSPHEPSADRSARAIYELLTESETPQPEG